MWLPNAQKLPPSAEVCISPSPFLHVKKICRSIYTASLFRTRGFKHRCFSGTAWEDAAELPSCQRPVISPILPGNANQAGWTHNMKWVLLQNTALVSGCQAGWSLLPVVSHLAYVKGRSLILQSSSSQTSRAHPGHLHPYIKEEATSQDAQWWSGEGLVWSSHCLPENLGC